ncbi:heavy metal translocating P-type ATPase metal-binding domain-containing protein [Sessilibacter sp. MAH1]
MNSAGNSPCYHCGLSVVDTNEFVTTLDGQRRCFCCPGCQAVAEAIHGNGLANFYQFRSELNQKPDSASSINYQAYDLPQLQEEFVFPCDVADDSSEPFVQARFHISGITCAACVWLIEHRLNAFDGVHKVSVNAATEQLVLQWQLSKVKLSEIMSAVASIGYVLTPASEDQQLLIRQREKRKALMRLSVAGFGMMQVGMVAVGLYAGASEEWLVYLRWVSLIIATPVVFFSARPFFEAAFRALKQKHLVMDVPVAIAIGFAYLASIWATIRATGEVYFDSVSMFTFLLLLGRYLEMRARHTNSLGNAKFTQLLPLTANRINREDVGQSRQTVALRSLVVGDWVAVGAGESIPCDGVVVDGESHVDESLLTGESSPVKKSADDLVVAGSVNNESSLIVQVTAVGQKTKLSAIERLVENASLNKPQQIALADKLSSYFVAAVLLMSAIIGGFWWLHEPSEALWIVLSVLVVTCPCALSLATPTAHASALSRLRAAGLLVLNSNCLAALAKVNFVAFDKTGTLTLGKPSVSECLPKNGQAEDALEIIASLEVDSRHPIAEAFKPWSNKRVASQVQVSTGKGVSGMVDNARYFFGNLTFCRQIMLEMSEEHSPIIEIQAPDDRQWLLLIRQEPQTQNFSQIAWVRLEDQIRPSAKPAINACRQNHMQVMLLSGDTSNLVSQVAKELSIDDVHGGVSPEQKLDCISEQQQRQGIVMMVGDGINDVPVLSGADVSVAMAQATDLAQTKADCILLNGDLTLIPQAIQFAKRLQTTIKQNLGWALAYNGLALPLAAFGYIPPWAAAIGMSLSSLIVVINASRLSKGPLVNHHA